MSPWPLYWDYIRWRTVEWQKRWFGKTFNKHMLLLLNINTLMETGEGTGGCLSTPTLCLVESFFFFSNHSVSLKKPISLTPVSIYIRGHWEWMCVVIVCQQLNFEDDHYFMVVTNHCISLLFFLRDQKSVFNELTLDPARRQTCVHSLTIRFSRHAVGGGLCVGWTVWVRRRGEGGGGCCNLMEKWQLCFPILLP